MSDLPHRVTYLLDWIDLLADPAYTLAVSWNESGPCVVLEDAAAGNVMWWPLT